ncbi:MAG: ATP-binding protein [Ignavibacteriaceae bacterium]
MDINFPTDIDQVLTESLLNSKLILDNSENVIYFYDYTTQKYDYMNPAIVDLTGYTMDELNEIGFRSIVREVLESKRNIEANQNSASSEILVEDFSAKYLIETRTGKLKWVEDISFTRITDGVKKDNCIGVLRNVTPLHSVFEQLQEEKNRLDAILDIAEIIFVVIDSDFTIRFINKKGCSVLGYEKENIIGKNWLINYIPSNLRAAVEIVFNNLFEGTVVDYETFENEVLTESGEKRVISWHNSLLRDENKKVKYLVASGYDVTNNKKDEKLQQIVSEILHAANSEKNLEELFRFIHASISRLMPADNFYIALYEKENDLIRFPYFVDQYDEEAPPKIFGKGLTEHVLRTGKSALITKDMDDELVQSGETELVGTPSVIWLGIPLKIQDNTIGVMVVQDYKNETTYGEKEKEILEVISYPISRAIERKIVEQERDDLIIKLKELNESKDKLFSLISHDLRSPFNSLLGFSEILTSEFDSLTQEEIKEYLNVIYESSKNLYSMTNNLLQFSRFQMGRFEFNPIKLNLKKLILNNINLLKGNLVKKQLNFITDIDIEAEVFADEDMLNSIVQNLISNAIKFTTRGGEIKISGRILSFFDEPNQVEISVQDSGVGISKDDLEKIFKDHMHSSPGTEKEYGTGLGLLLVKEFIQINGGKIKIKSKPGKGTTFIFTLPVLS